MMDYQEGIDYAAELVSTRPKQPLDDLLDYAKQYARERPEMVALWCFAIGFVLGWRLKPW